MEADPMALPYAGSGVDERDKVVGLLDIVVGLINRAR
jgi:hypothetical protein